MPKPAEQELTQAVQGFVRHLADERRASPHTVSAYRRDLDQLGAFLRERLGTTPRLADVDRMALRAWLADLGARSVPNTLSRKLAAVRSMFVWLVRQGRLPKDPSRDLQAPKVRRKLPGFLGPDAAAEVMSAPLEQAGALDAARLRDAAALEILYGCGLRVSELVALDLDDVSLEREELRVLGKGRRIVISERTPSFVLETEEGRWYLDTNATVLLRVTGGASALPTIRLGHELAADTGDRIHAREVVDAITLWTSLPRSLRAGAPIVEAAPSGFVLIRPEVFIRFGTIDQLDDKLEAVALVMNRSRRSPGKLAMIDVRSPTRPAAEMA